MIELLYSELNYGTRVSNPQGTEGSINKMCLNSISDIIPNNGQSNSSDSKKDHYLSNRRIRKPPNRNYDFYQVT
jgi:hypothetical protein